jgi:transcriptional regulator with XRE-family HTH domain
MTNHPGRKPGSAQLRMAPEHLRDIIERAGITQARAAELAGVAERTMRQYLAGDREMPLSASGLLVVSLVLLGAPAALLQPWIPDAVREQIARRPRLAQGVSSSGA